MSHMNEAVLLTYRGETLLPVVQTHTMLEWLCLHCLRCGKTWTDFTSGLQLACLNRVHSDDGGEYHRKGAGVQKKSEFDISVPSPA